MRGSTGAGSDRDRRGLDRHRAASTGTGAASTGTGAASTGTGAASTGTGAASTGTGAASTGTGAASVGTGAAPVGAGAASTGTGAAWVGTGAASVGTGAPCAAASSIASGAPGAAVGVVGPTAAMATASRASSASFLLAPPLDVLQAAVVTAARAVVALPAFGEEPPTAVVAFAVLADVPGIDPPCRYPRGFCACPFTRVSKWTCGPVQLPVQPTYPITWPCCTRAPWLTANDDMCA